MSCRIIFVRHGQSIGNLNNVYLGHTDLDLSPLGLKQAEYVGEYLSKRKIDMIYCSDLKRAYQTALPLANLKNIKPIKTQALREIFAGKWENRLFSDLEEVFFETYGLWLSNIGLSCPDDGESVAMLQKRIIAEVERIAKENEGKTVAVFTHATPIRTFFAFIRGMELNEIKDIPWATNTSVSEVEYNDGKFTEICYSRDEFLGNITTAFPNNV